MRNLINYHFRAGTAWPNAANSSVSCSLLNHQRQRVARPAAAFQRNDVFLRLREVGFSVATSRSQRGKEPPPAKLQRWCARISPRAISAIRRMNAAGSTTDRRRATACRIKPCFIGVVRWLMPSSPAAASRTRQIKSRCWARPDYASHREPPRGMNHRQTTARAGRLAAPCAYNRPRCQSRTVIAAANGPRQNATAASLLVAVHLRAADFAARTAALNAGVKQPGLCWRPARMPLIFQTAGRLSLINSAPSAKFARRPSRVRHPAR